METVKMKQNKGGRPVKPVKKEIKITIRFSKAEYFIVKEKAAKAGTRASVYLRQTGIQGKVTAKLTPEESVWVKQVIGMANNLNQLAKACHEEGILQAMLLFENYRNELDTLLHKLKS
ncbi:plasmid mobilization protein [Chitinophagaceae bacterium LWZ2-11]